MKKHSPIQSTWKRLRKLKEQNQINKTLDFIRLPPLQRDHKGRDWVNPLPRHILLFIQLLVVSTPKSECLLLSQQYAIFIQSSFSNVKMLSTLKGNQEPMNTQKRLETTSHQRTQALGFSAGSQRRCTVPEMGLLSKAILARKSALRQPVQFVPLT